jgi:hypothetical protein
MTACIVSLPAIFARHRQMQGLPIGQVVRKGATVWKVKVTTTVLASIIADVRLSDNVRRKIRSQFNREPA